MKKGLTRRDFLAIGGGASLALALSGCGFGVGESKGGSDTGAVTLWDISTGEELELVKDRLRRFNSGDFGGRVEMQTFEADAFKQKLRVAMGANTPPDIWHSWGGGILGSYVDGKKVYDLTQDLNANAGWKDKYLASVMGPVTFDGRVYGEPFSGTQPVVFFYNKNIFDKYGISPPATWDETLQVVERLKKEGVIPISLAGKEKWTNMMYLEYLADRLGGPEAFGAVLREEPGAWSQPAFIEANTMIQDLVSAGAFPDGFNSLSYLSGQASALVYTGKAAMQLMGAWDYGTILSAAPNFIEEGNLGWFAFPALDGGAGDPKNLAGNPSNYYCISSSTGNTELAVTFLREAVLDEEEIDARIKSGEVLPLKGIRPKLEEAGNKEWLLFLYDLIQEAPNFDQSWDQSLPPEPAQALLTNLDRLFLKEISPKQFSENMNKTLEQG